MGRLGVWLGGVLKKSIVDPTPAKNNDQITKA